MPASEPVVGAECAAEPAAGGLPDAGLARQQLARIGAGHRAVDQAACTPWQATCTHTQIGARSNGGRDAQRTGERGGARIANADKGFQIGESRRRIRPQFGPCSGPKRQRAGRIGGRARHERIAEAECGAPGLRRRLGPDGAAIAARGFDDGCQADQVW
ncbi:hypothetical protein G6F31_016707 [Rhizopus arrhizus]|nr:hypothetical protein G6F31_016707 [Rhizopus arrhizus]